MDIPAFLSKWHLASGGERKTKDYFLLDLCTALGVPPPDVAQDRYGFEADVLSVHEGGKTTILRVDLYKHGCFILEAKQGSNPGDPKAGHGKRGSEAWNKSMQNAYGQAVGYARSMDDPPPFLVVCDIGYVFELYADFDRSGYYRPFPNAQRHRRFLVDLEVHAKDLRALFLDPLSLDPARAGIKVTREIAEDLAEIAKLLEKKGHAPTLVAKFLMRCLFTMFAEDVELLPDDMFTKLLQKSWTKKPATFVGGVEQLWRVMSSGGYYGPELVRHFNGGLFEDPVALPLDEKGLKILLRAAEREWADVEPSIFGTLLERALDPKERHKLGAHFTPRAYVERLVRPTIEEPLRTEWENTKALSLKLRGDGKLDTAKEVVHAFHQKLCATRVLDPACGSGNFLYVTLNILKQIESEVLALLVEMGEKQEQLIRITPGNFRGIEVKPWGKEIAELVLWIGYLQWHYRTHGKGMPPPSPVLQDYGNIECRDAVLAWDKINLLRDEKGKPITRWDGETYKKSAVTGEPIPNDDARVESYVYINPRKAEWPKSDFIVGNPPFIGTKRMRAILGDGYVDALRSTYSTEIDDSADYVMYWWETAAHTLEEKKVRGFGLITTNSISQTFNRRVVRRHIDAGTRIVWAIPDHPWSDNETGAAVRIAMTSATSDDSRLAQLLTVELEAQDSEALDGTSKIELSVETGGIIRENLRMGADIVSARPLQANSSVSGMGIALHGSGFVLEPEKASRLRQTVRDTTIRPYVGGRDLLQRSRERYVIDFSGMTEEMAKKANPAAFQHVIDHILPERRHNQRDSIRNLWWRFGWERPLLRRALQGVCRLIGTTETAKHRVFQFIDRDVLPDHMVVVIASDDAANLGILSSKIHVTWALAAGGRLGVGNDPRYNKTRCFDPFPFPICSPAQQKRIRSLSEQLDAHRKRQQAAHPDLTITGMYNVLEKLRANAELTDKDRVIHEHGLLSLLRKIHDDLDAAVFDAYGWSPDITDEQILEKLVALNAERAEEEKKGLIRWLRPDFQNPSGIKTGTQAPLLTTGEDDDPQSDPAPEAIKPWPKKIAEQVAAVRDRVAFPGKLFTVESVAAAFKGAKKKDIEGFLDGFAALGVLTAFEGASGKRWRAAGKAT